MATEASPGVDMGMSCGSTSVATQPRRVRSARRRQGTPRS